MSIQGGDKLHKFVTSRDGKRMEIEIEISKVYNYVELFKVVWNIHPIKSLEGLETYETLDVIRSYGYVKKTNTD